MKRIRLLNFLYLALLIPFNLQAQDINKGFSVGPASSVEGGLVKTHEGYYVFEEEIEDNFMFTFEGKTLEGEMPQIWAGFNFNDRSNRYAIGIRGGNSNDIYLVHYETIGKDKPLAIVPIEEKFEIGEWYKLTVKYFDGHIHVYLGEETQPRIVVADKNPIGNGKVYVGGGWLPTVYQNIKVTSLSSTGITKLKEETQQSKLLSATEKEEKRVAERAKYKAQNIKSFNKGRTVVSLNGDWLFMPTYAVNNSDEPSKVESTDQEWHILNVPNFWNPARNWLHGQDSKLPSWGSGISDTYERGEIDRCNNYTFEYTKTNGGWYRHWINLKKLPENKRFQIHFDAVAKVSDVYVNGALVGEHVGMFGEFSYDITDQLKEGENLIAVFVKARHAEKSNDGDENIARAVSVDVTNDMIKSIPFGMFEGSEGGIWQGVDLIVTDDVAIEDVFANVNSKGGQFEVTVENTLKSEVKRTVKIDVYEKGSKKVFWSGNTALDIPASAKNTANIKIENIDPKLWSPEFPNLYTAKVQLLDNGNTKDLEDVQFGFRSIETEGNHFLLNGLPYWMRGANHPPCGIAPNNEELANKFMKLMHDGNQMITRAHGAPFTKAWFNAADEQGVGVSNEGSWPWMMIGDMPPEEMIEVFKQETIALVKKYRNHPSMLVWTMNNEMYFTMFYHDDPREVRIQKWKYLTEIIQEVRRLLPNVPISADSGYDRLQEDYDTVLKPNGIDDGDLDDRHIYFSWYNRDFYQIYDGEWDKRIYWTPGANADRPFFAQEVSTGYPNNDIGHFTRKYIYKHYVPHAWVGEYAWEDHDPKYGLDRHGFMTKELCEVIRRTTPQSGGILLFANVAWFQNVTDADRIKPYPVYEQFKLGMQPVLVSAELFGRNFFAGESLNPNVYLVNHDVHGKNLSNLSLKWEIEDNGQITKSGKVSFADVAHFTAEQQKVKIDLPTTLSADKVTAKLKLTVTSNNEQVSYNEYDLELAQPSWYADIKKLEGKKIGLVDINGDTKEVFDNLNIPYFELKDLTQIRFAEMDLLVIANVDQLEEVPYGWEDVRKVMRNGQNTLLIHPGKHMEWMMFDRIDDIYERKGRVVQQSIIEHDVFKEIGPTALAWWQQEGRTRPRACRRSFRFSDKEGVTPLAYYLRPHVYVGNPEKELLKMSGVPLALIEEGEGQMITSEMELNAHDPIASKLLVNIISFLTK